MSYQWLEKYFPKYTNEQIKNELNLFKQVYNEVVLKVCWQVNNIIGNKDQNKEIIEGLREYFPGYNKKFILTLKENVENINIQVNDIISILNLIAYKFNIVVNVRNNLYKRNSPVEQSWE